MLKAILGGTTTNKKKSRIKEGDSVSKIWGKFAAIALCVAVSCGVSLAQVPPLTMLEIDLENRVNYVTDVFDVTKFATDLLKAPTAARNFTTGIRLGDIVAVNGRPAKGTHVARFQNVNLNTAPTPGQAIADTTAVFIWEQTYQILQPDGTLIGSIMAAGLGGGPSESAAGDNTILGGTGAFIGVRGQSSRAPQLSAPRNASVTEDPANRRRNGGGTARVLLQLIPLSRPEIITTQSGPAIAHSNDFSLVTAARPARPGESLSLFATGLGPTRPGVDPGKPFPANPLAVVNSPVEVTVNGKPAEVTAAVGYPGAVNGYQVNFRLPADAASGLATIQLSAAWITGPEVRVAVQ